MPTQAPQFKSTNSSESIRLGGAFLAKTGKSREAGVCNCYLKGVSLINADGLEVSLDGLAISVRPNERFTVGGTQPQFLLSLWKPTPKSVDLSETK
jgi:hypothetical protein